MSAINKVIFTTRYPLDSCDETISKPIGETWETCFDIGWPLYRNHTIDNIKYKINKKECRGVCYCSNDQCSSFNQYMTAHSDAKKRHTTKCKECNNLLILEDCPVKVTFIHNLTNNKFRMEHEGKHNHEQCSDYNKRKLVTIDTDVIDHPLHLVHNHMNSCFIDAPIELLLNSVIPCFPFKIAKINETVFDLILGNAYSLYHHKNNKQGRKFALDSIRNHIRMNTHYKGIQFGSVDFVLNHFLQQVSGKVMDMFVIKDMLIDSACKDEHCITTKKTIGPIITATTPSRYFFGPSEGKPCKQNIRDNMRCGKPSYFVKAFCNQPLPLFLFFSKADNQTLNKAPYPYEFTLQQTTYLIQSIIYLEVANANHFYTITKIKNKKKTFLAKVDNMEPKMTVLTTDPTHFYDAFYHTPKNHYDVVILYKKN
jgi:hypothetical protein